MEEAGCIELADTRPVRGSVEHRYRGTARAYFKDEEWAKLAPAERRAISRTMLQGLIARAEGAMLADTFDSRTDRHLAWVPLALDERGWSELSAAIASCYGEVEQIRHDAKERLAASGEVEIPATFGMLSFESPPSTARASV